MAGNNKMLIDATHPEETRVAVVKGNRVEEFDFESQDKHQIRGNIYLAKVTRVEPSLQAAFVDYGGNRHGFLPFAEIHPDYYQIPLADREALLQAELEEQQALAKDEEAEEQKPKRRRSRQKAEAVADESVSEEAEIAKDDDADADETEPSAQTSSEQEASDDDANDDAHSDEDGDEVDDAGQDDALEEVAQPQKRIRKQYKIQEVIKRRQILLIQVVKEERGNKGAALTTYLSLAGRYCVLMPNTPRGGGISRKITDVSDRKRLKAIAGELDVPKGMGVIVRTAGASRTGAEINRDYGYLSRLWENVRSLTLESSAPCLVYEEGDLIKRSIRDLYNRDINEILVSGDGGYRDAKDFMRLLMPSQSRKVQPYRAKTPLFVEYGIENQLDGMMKPEVTLKSGGYIVIHQTEALVAIDVNSGRSTKEGSIEETALKTNLEASEEVARQLRLRDLAGLIVIDFIDMTERRNNRAVEKKLKDCLRNDRARIQLGRISHFGLMEMSRQRLRASVIDSTTNMCPHCHGSGLIRAESTMALEILRAIEDAMLRGGKHDVLVSAYTDIALFMLNHKREALTDLEQRYGRIVTITADSSIGHQDFKVEKGELTSARARPEMVKTVQPDSVTLADEEDARIDAELAAKAAEEENSEETNEGTGEGTGKKRRRRGRRDRRGADNVSENSTENEQQADESEAENKDSAEGADTPEAQEDEDGKTKRRRRGRRGGRRNRKDSVSEGENTQETSQDTPQDTEQSSESAEKSASEEKSDETSEEKPKRRNTRRKPAAPKAAAEEVETSQSVSEEAKTPEDTTEEKPKRRKRRTKAEIEADKKAKEEAKSQGNDEKTDAKADNEAGSETSSEDKDKRPARRNTRRKTATEKNQSDAAPETSASEDRPAEDRPAENKGTEKDEKEKPKSGGGWWQRRAKLF